MFSCVCVKCGRVCVLFSLVIFVFLVIYFFPLKQKHSVFFVGGSLFLQGFSGFSFIVMFGFLVCVCVFLFVCGVFSPSCVFCLLYVFFVLSFAFGV